MVARFRIRPFIVCMKTHRAAQKTDAQPRPITGWSLPILLRLDETSPGFARFVMRASPLRRQLFALLASEVVGAGAPDVAFRLAAQGAPVEIITEAITSWHARKIITAVFGDVPDAYIGCLAKAGDQPLDHPRLYRTLYDLLADGATQRAVVLRQATKIESAQIEYFAKVDPALWGAGFIRAFHATYQVDAVNYIARLARELGGADDERIAASARSHTDPAAWAKSWFARMQALPHSAPHLGPEFRILTSAEDIKDVALRYQNCARTRMAPVFTGRELLVEHVDHRVLIQMLALTEGRYLVKDFWGPSNKTRPTAATKDIAKRLGEAGILFRSAWLQPEIVSSTMRLVDLWDGDGRYFGLDDG